MCFNFRYLRIPNTKRTNTLPKDTSVNEKNIFDFKEEQVMNQMAWPTGAPLYTLGSSDVRCRCLCHTSTVKNEFDKSGRHCM